MSEVEKMYRRCKIKKRQTCRSSDTCYNGSLNACEGCNSYQFPPFTAEKQLELIKWLGKLADISNINIECENKKICIHNVLGQSGDCDTIEDALSGYINQIWQDLTEQERTEIAEILRG